jgi:hypothetical protein
MKVHVHEVLDIEISTRRVISSMLESGDERPELVGDVRVREQGAHLRLHVRAVEDGESGCHGCAVLEHRAAFGKGVVRHGAHSLQAL